VNAAAKEVTMGDSQDLQDLQDAQVTARSPKLHNKELPKHMKEMLVPAIGTQLGIGNKLFKVTYRNVGKLRFTATFVGEMNTAPTVSGPAPGSDTIATRNKLIVTPEEAISEAQAIEEVRRRGGHGGGNIIVP
jgi:hypothetical protein